MRTVAHFIDSKAFGGTEQILLNLLAGLSQRGWRSMLYHHPEPDLIPLFEAAHRLGVELRELRRMERGRALPSMLQLLQDLRSERPVVFHAHLSWPGACRYGLLAAALARVPAVVATVQLFLEPGRRGRWAQGVVGFGVDRYIAVSQAVAERLRDRLSLAETKICVVRNGIELHQYERTRERPCVAGLRGRAARPLILTLGRLDHQKGLNYLLQAAVLIPEATFLLAGEGPERHALEMQVRVLNLHDRVAFLGHRDDAAELLAACDLFVLPSLFEGFPLAVMEAAVTGKPIVATAVGGTDEAVIHGVTGLLVPPADPSALAAAIRSLLDNPVLADRLGAAARAHALGEFAAETMVRRVTDVYEDVLAWRGTEHG